MAEQIVDYPYPTGQDWRDVLRVIAASTPQVPKGIDQQVVDGSTKVRLFFDPPITQQQITNLGTAIAATSADPNAPWRINDTLVAQAEQALLDNATFYNTPNGSITQAAVLAQTKALSRQNNKIIRMLLGKFDGTD